MVEGIDYLAARAAGMSARLLPEERLRALLSVEDFSAWWNLLYETPYARELGTAPKTREGPPLLLAVDRSVAARTHKLSRISAGREGRILSVLLAEWDLRNLLALVTGLTLHSPPPEILSSTLAGGLLGPEQLRELSASHGLREVADRLATWTYPYHLAFRASLGRKTVLPLMEVRLGLVRAFFQRISAEADSLGDPVLRDYLAARTDQTNLTTAFMWKSLPSDRNPEEFHLQGRGVVTLAVFSRMLKAPTVEKALDSLPDHSLRRTLSESLIKHELLNRTSIFHQALERALYRRFTRPLTLDPIGTSRVLSYLLRLRREGILLKLAVTRIALGVPGPAFQEMMGDV